MITPYSDPVVGGITTFVQNLSAALRREGLEVVIVSRNGAGGDEVRIVDGRPMVFAREAARITKAIDPDAIHAHAHWYALRAGVGATRRTHRRLVFTFHTAATGRGTLRGWAFRRLLAKCDSITFPSEHLRTRIGAGLPRAKTFVIHPGVGDDATRSNKTFQGDRDTPAPALVTIGYVGQFEWPEKVLGFRILLQSMLQPELRAARLIVAGKGSMLHDIEVEIQELGLADRVTLLGEVRDPGQVYRASDIYCHPSLQEGMSIAVLEAMSAGLPIVGVSQAFMSESVRDGIDGILTDPDPDSLAAALGRLAADPALAARLGENARAHVLRDFSWEDTARQFMVRYGVKT